MFGHLNLSLGGGVREGGSVNDVYTVHTGQLSKSDPATTIKQVLHCLQSLFLLSIKQKTQSRKNVTEGSAL